MLEPLVTSISIISNKLTIISRTVDGGYWTCSGNNCQLVAYNGNTCNNARATCNTETGNWAFKPKKPACKVFLTCGQEDLAVVDQGFWQCDGKGCRLNTIANSNAVCTGEATCDTKRGVWKYKPKKYGCVIEKVCGPTPDPIDNGSWSCAGGRCTLECEPGFTSKKSAKAICKKGSWIVKNAICNAE